MTRKDYIAIAAVIKNRVDACGAYIEAELATHEVAKDLAELLSKDNPQFNRAKFLEACGV
jgi:hypothetical protein